MRKTKTDPRKRALLQKTVADFRREKEAWKNYEMNLKRTGSSYSELEFEDY